jgi:hypothetical protein
MEKFKYILLCAILLCTITTFAQPAQYTPMTAAGYQMKRLKVDSTLHLPSFCGVPTIHGSLAKEGALAIDTCGKLLYMWTRTGGWDTINVSGGGSSTDTTSLSNRINQRIDSLIRRNDSIFARKNGVFVFQYKDSVGGGVDSQNLQQVTDVGSTTTNTITSAGLNLLTGSNSINLTNGFDGSFVIKNTGTSDEILNVNNGASGYLKFGGGAGNYVQINVSPNGNVELTAPSTNGIIPISVNGNTADASGNITISTGGVAVDTIFRTLGKDSIFYKKNNITYAIKDSVGTNPPANGYYGAFQDNTTQTAASINTAYAVKLNTTDLTNGVTVANNSKIKIANAGIYNIQFSLQLEKTGGSGNMIADIWLRKNGVNLDGTTGKVVLTGSANASPVVAAWNYVVAVSSNDSLELMWATSNTNVEIVAAVATAPHPSIPSAILTVTQQSGIMAGTGISPLDTANMLSNYARTNLVNTKLNISDTASMLSSYSTRINGKLNIADTASMLSSYSTRINGKLNISDTTVFQRKQIPSYTFLANNTPATANATTQYFKDTSGTYTGTITWNGTAPTGGNLTYRWTRIGKMVNINISLIYSTQGSANSTLTVTLPSDAPTPSKPGGLTSALNQLYPIVGSVNITNSSTLTNSATRGFLRNNAANNGFEFILNYSAATAANAYITCTYFTD